LMARQSREQLVIQGTAQIFYMHCDVLPGGPGRFSQGGGWKPLQWAVLAGRFLHIETNWTDCPFGTALSVKPANHGTIRELAFDRWPRGFGLKIKCPVPNIYLPALGT
jgi:hypothetical protein